MSEGLFGRRACRCRRIKCGFDGEEGGRIGDRLIKISFAVTDHRSSLAQAGAIGRPVNGEGRENGSCVPICTGETSE